MGRFTWLSSDLALGRFGSLLQRLRRSVVARGPAVRWGLAAVTIVILVLLGYLGVGSLTTAESAYLGSGRRYGPDDLIKITRVLERQRFPYHIDDQRRVAVASEQLEQASAAISKLPLGPRPPGEIRDDQSAGSNFWESLHDKELREYQGREKILESMIGDLPGIVGSFVWINRPKPRWGLQPVVKPSAFVRLETEGDRQLPFRTVQALTTILTGYEPGLTADAVTVVDRRGHKYLDAGNPALSALSHNRAREEELSQEILEQLDWIGGVRVSVQLSETVSPGLDPVTPGHSQRRDTVDSQTLRSAQDSKHADPPTRPEAPPASSAEPKVSAPAGAINRPLALEPELPSPSPSPPPPGRDGRACTEPHNDRDPTVSSRPPHHYSNRGSRCPGRNRPGVGESPSKLLLSRQYTNKPQGAPTRGIAEAGRPDGRTDQDGDRAGRTPVGSLGLEDDDRHDSRRGAAPTPSGRLTALRCSADRAGLGNRRGHGGAGRRLGDVGIMDLEHPSPIGSAGSGSQQAALP